MLRKLLHQKYKRKYLKMKKAAVRLRGVKAAYKKEVSELRRRVSLLEDGYVVEWCQECDTQITMLWDVKKDGCRACCPHCGAVMMLCDSCQGECDYNYGNDTCKEM
ncbi:MAG: hypothetical protein HDR09_12830 [Lachnospiraceae bacterium]|nr:hypothetical protein [Lachnospiraceae bacterium]